jgi:hypothetical protein
MKALTIIALTLIAAIFVAPATAELEPYLVNEVPTEAEIQGVAYYLSYYVLFFEEFKVQVHEEGMYSVNAEILSKTTEDSIRSDERYKHTVKIVTSLLKEVGITSSQSRLDNYQEILTTGFFVQRLLQNNISKENATKWIKTLYGYSAKYTSVCYETWQIFVYVLDMKHANERTASWK